MAATLATDEGSKRTLSTSYSEMILAAIQALDEKNGSNKTAISQYIESTYSDLPSSHSTLLVAHLARMKESGELVFVKNNYTLPVPGSSPPSKRGRGRPPKPKELLPPGVDASPPASTNSRPRGRPPKQRDPFAVAVAKLTSGLPRRRGRPPKTYLPAVHEKAFNVPSPAVAPNSGVVKKGRGRPPKVKPQFADVGFA